MALEQSARALEPYAEQAASRRKRAAELVAATGGDRTRLKARRARLLDRLHRASDDVAATDDLRIVDLALSRSPSPEGLWAWQRREHERRPWWRRRRR